MIHTIKPSLLQRPVRVTLIGAGGTGSHVLRKLAVMNIAMHELGHPGGLEVTVIDPDTVSKTNVGRQDFYPSDVGHSKAAILVHRCNMRMQTEWKAVQQRITSSSRLNADIVIACVDNRAARKAILSAIEGSLYSSDFTYYLDMGNREHDGQVILGQVFQKKVRLPEGYVRLPHAGDLFPEIIDETLDDQDDTPSCSLADALSRQSLLVNENVAVAGMNLLWELLRYGQISHHGLFINIKSGRVSPLSIDPESWKRFGYKVPVKRKRKTAEKLAA